MGKYDPLRDLLASRQLDEVVLTFGEVEKLVGPLPPSAHEHRAWWANDSKVQAQAWRSAGWHVAAVDQTTERVTFARGSVGGAYLATRKVEPAAGGMPRTRGEANQQNLGSDTTEEAVQGRLVAYLVKEGWRILRVAHTATRERGTDVLATRHERTLAVEVKGYPSLTYADPRRAGELKPTQPATQARHWYAQAVLKCMLIRDEQPDVDVAIALPDVPTYRSLFQRTKTSLHRTGVNVLFVAGDGEVSPG
jgi:hypothetical protein